MKNRGFRERVGFALEGLVAGWRRERSFRTHVVAASAAFVALLVLHPLPVWWGLVGIAATTVMMLELLNSAIESLTDLLHPAVHPEIKAIKDMLAGAVLLASAASLIIAGALVVDRLPWLLQAIQ